MENDHRNSKNINNVQETSRGMTYIYFSPNIENLDNSIKENASIDRSHRSSRLVSATCKAPDAADV